MRPPLSIHANGKILLSGEYLVMQGALALAVPLKAGQELTLAEGEKEGVLLWEAYDTAGLWFRGTFSLPGLTVLESTDDAIAQRLAKLLLAARSHNGRFLADGSGLKAVSRLEFSRNWGFGSSSTLISIVARWAGLQPMALHHLLSQGSGYDVACSVADSPILYTLQNNRPRITPADFNPPFADSMFLVYLGNKQHTDTEVEKFRQRPGVDFRQEIQRVSNISLLLVKEVNIEIFMELLAEHEAIMKNVLDRGTIKELLFPDFEGVVKSLGAWGGDFVLAVSSLGEGYVRDYFSRKSLLTIIPYSSIVLMPEKKEIITG